jgi:predicted RNA binding protein YcfA (HicA-like mRNA interferase family)
MSLQFYKPNPTSTGTACSFWQNPDGFWVSLIKQDGWNAKARTGSFSKNKKNPQKRVIVKFQDNEICGFIDAINRNAEYSGYHDSQKQIIKFRFKPYLKDGEQVGYSFSVQKEAKEDSTDKQSYLMGFYFNEGEQLKLYLQMLIQENFKATDETLKAADEKFKGNRSPQFTSTTASTTASKSTSSDDDDDYDF